MKKSGRAFGLRVLGLLLSYLLVYTITQLYDASVLGMFTLTLTVVQILATLGIAGLDLGLLRMISERVAKGEWIASERTYEKGILFSLALSTLLGASVFFMAERIAEGLFSSPGMTPYIRVAGPAAIALSLSRIGSESLRALKKIEHYVLLKQVGTHLTTLVFIALGYFAFYRGEELPILAYAMGVGLLALLGFISWKKSTSGKKGMDGHESPPALREMLSISMPMLLASSLFMVINWTDTLMLGFFMEEKDVGVYNIAYRIANVSNLILFAVKSIAVPKISEAYHSGNTESLRKDTKNATFMIFWATTPIVLIIAIFPQFLLSLFGDEFRVGWIALLLITGGKFISALSGSVGQILQMTGNEKNFQTIVLTACILNISLNYLLIPLYGIQGAATASLSSIAFMNLSSVLLVKRKLGFFTISILGRG